MRSPSRLMWPRPGWYAVEKWNFTLTLFCFGSRLMLASSISRRETLVLMFTFPAVFVFRSARTLVKLNPTTEAMGYHLFFWFFANFFAKPFFWKMLEEKESLLCL